MPKASLDITVGEYNGTPGFAIDAKIIEPNTLSMGDHTLEFEYDYGESVCFKMFGKDVFDTKIDDENNIIEDKFILIKQLRIEYMQISNWQFHKHLWNPYFAYNNEERVLAIPSKETLPLWYLNLQN
tara:strand:- start:2936 stop:3316 length:381 start_codon:yes stop_codon:yes gene_type:complete